MKWQITSLQTPLIKLNSDKITSITVNELAQDEKEYRVENKVDMFQKSYLIIIDNLRYKKYNLYLDIYYKVEKTIGI